MLIERISGREVPVSFRPIESSELRSLGITKRNGWLFDWRGPFRKGFDVFGLYTLQNPNSIEGLVAVKALYRILLARFISKYWNRPHTTKGEILQEDM